MAVDIAAVLTANIEQFKASMGEADASVAALSKSGGSNLSKLSAVGQGALLGVAGAAAVVAGASVDLAAKYQTTTSDIAANAQISTSAAQKIGAAFLSTAGTTIYSGQQIATAYAAVAGQLGATQGHALTAKQAMDVMRASMDLAEGSGTDLATATSSLSTVMQAYGIKAGGASKASDVLFNSSRLTGNSVSSVTAIFQKLGSSLGAVAPPMDQVGGLMLDLAKNHETGRKAISAVNTALNGILAPTAAVAANQKALGLNVFDSTGKFAGMGSVITQLGPILANHTQQQQLAILKSLGFGTANKALLDTILAGPAAYQKDVDAVGKSGSAHDAASKQSQTFQHQIDTLKVAAEDYGVELGQKLIPIIEDVARVTGEVIGWFKQHQDVTIALGAAIGALVAGAIAVYLVNVGQKMVTATGNAIESIGKLTTAIFGSGATADTASAQIEGTGVAAETTGGQADAASGQVEGLGAAASTTGGEVEGLGAAAGTSAGEVEGLGAAAGTSATEVEGLGTASGLAGGEMAAAGGEEGAGALAGGLSGISGEAGLAGASLGGPVVLGIAAAAFGLAGLGFWLSNNKQAWQQTSGAALSYADTTLPDMVNKLGLLKTALDQNDAALKTVKKATDDQTGAGAAEGFASNETAQHVMQLKDNHDALTSAIQKTTETTQQYNSNLSILESTFGITEGQAINLAQAAGVSLHGALTVANLDSLNVQSGISGIGTQADTASGKVSSMGAYASQALDALASKLHSTGTAADWGQLGQDIDFGIGNGITSNAGFVINAAQGMVQSVISASRTGLKAKSPSQVFADLGTTIPQGLAAGIKAQGDLATNAVTGLVGQMVSAVGPSGSSIVPIVTSSNSGSSAASGSGGGLGNVQIVLQMDGTLVAQALFPGPLFTQMLQQKRALVELGLS